MLRKILLVLVAITACIPAVLLASDATPDQVLVIYEKNWTDSDGNGKSDSLDVAEYYMSKRGIPVANILEVDTGATQPYDTHLSLANYETKLAAPLRNWLDTNSMKDKIFYIVMCLGVPYGITGTSTCADALLTDPYTPIGGTRSGTFGTSPVRNVTFERVSNSHIWSGRSSLTPYYLVCRMDGPSLAIAKGLVDKAMKAEADKLWKYHPYKAYVDSGSAFPSFEDDCILPNVGIFSGLGWEVKQETGALLFSFLPNCLWYSGTYAHTYRGAFTFETGAVALHMESMVAWDFRNRNNRTLFNQTWCAGFLNTGVTATAGTIDEPYLSGVLMQNVFFDRFLKPENKFNFANAIYAANAYSAGSSADWMMIMIGDPLYCIFNSPADPVVVVTANPFDPVKVYPQPFNPETSTTGGMRWSELPIDAKLEISDGTGTLLKTINEVDQGNTTIIRWDGKDEAGNLLPRGMYYYALSNGAFKKTGKIAYVR